MPHAHRIGDIDLGDLDRCALRVQFSQDRLLGWALDAAPPGKNQLACALGHQPLGTLQSQAPQPTGDKIDPIALNDWRIRAQGWLRSNQARHVTFTAAIGDLLLVIGLQNFSQQGLGRGLEWGQRIDINQATPMIAMFQGNHPAHAPK